VSFESVVVQCFRASAVREREVASESTCAVDEEGGSPAGRSLLWSRRQPEIVEPFVIVAYGGDVVRFETVALTCEDVVPFSRAHRRGEVFPFESVVVSRWCDASAVGEWGGASESTRPVDEEQNPRPARSLSLSRTPPRRSSSVGDRLGHGELSTVLLHDGARASPLWSPVCVLAVSEARTVAPGRRLQACRRDRLVAICVQLRGGSTKPGIDTRWRAGQPPPWRSMRTDCGRAELWLQGVVRGKQGRYRVALTFHRGEVSSTCRLPGRCRSVATEVRLTSSEHGP